MAGRERRMIVKKESKGVNFAKFGVPRLRL